MLTFLNPILNCVSSKLGPPVNSPLLMVIFCQRVHFRVKAQEMGLTVTHTAQSDKNITPNVCCADKNLCCPLSASQPVTALILLLY